MSNKKLEFEKKKRRIRCGFALVLIGVLFTTQIASAYPIIPQSTSVWYTIALIAVVTIIFIAAIVYMLAGVIDSPQARAWARFQVYEGVLSILFIVIFIAFISFLFLDSEAAFAAVNLVPLNQVNTIFNCSTAYDLFTLATCNISVFQRFAFGLFSALYYTTIYLGFTPGVELSLKYQLGNTQITGGSALDSIIPFSAETALAFAYDALIVLLVLNQIQAMLLAGSMLWLGFFVTLGVIARAFGFTRTFGGAMIAMGLGLGVVYPLVTNVTYGFINATLACNPSAAVNCVNIPNTGAAIASQLITGILGIFFYQGYAWSGGWVFAVGMAVAGLTFIPFLNFTVVDAFIVDFSRAIGEQINFMSLLTNII